MKKLLLILLSCYLLVGCGSNNTSVIDLTTSSITVRDAQLINIINSAKENKGKTVKIKGTYDFATVNNKVYHLCIFQSSCCGNGLEFISKNGSYPERNQAITVEGKFSVYYENEIPYYTLLNAEWIEIDRKDLD